MEETGLFTVLHIENPLTLYHGSVGGIRGRIGLQNNENLCDFGNGFYLGDVKEQAENRVCNVKDGFVYTFRASFEGLRGCLFTDPALWGLYIGFNRRKLTEIPPELLSVFREIGSFDYIAGWIADDKLSAAYTDFLDGLITDICLAECLKLVKYGNQYVCKSREALQALTLTDCHPMEKELRTRSLSWGRMMKRDMDRHLEEIRRRYRREGRFVDECLDSYR